MRSPNSMPEELPLHSLCKSRSASFLIIQNWNLPVHFENIASEYQAAHDSAVLIDRSWLGKIRITGADRINVLHNVLTQDIKNIKTGSGRPAALLSATGKILAMMQVLIFEDYVLLVVEMNQVVKTMEHLQRYVITEDVNFEDVTRNYALLTIIGPQAEDFVKTGPGNLNAWPSLDPRIGRAPWPSLDMFIPVEQAETSILALLDQNSAKGLKLAGYETFELLRIEAGMPRYGIDITEEISLPEAGLDTQLDSETKGCYPGQEVVARTRTYGGLQKKLVRLEFEGGNLPSAGDKIFSEEVEIGRITSACFLPNRKQGRAFGLIANSHFGKTEKVRIGDVRNDVPASCFKPG